MFGSWSFGGSRGNESVTLGGLLQDANSPIGMRFNSSEKRHLPNRNASFYRTHVCRL
jgi:hypothetical protein